MKRTNRVEPVSTGNDASDLARATVTTTTRMEFVRRVQVLPMQDAVAQLHSDLNQSLAGEVTISPRIWTGMHRPTTPVTVRSSRRALWCIGCVFITVGLLALFAMIAGISLAFGKTNAIGESDIERYDVGDLDYGIDNVNSTSFASNTYLSSDNKASVQQYLYDQLLNEPGFRGLYIDGVLVQQQPGSGRKRRDTSCDAIFVVKNIQIYFDYCSTCAGSRNLAIRRSLSNITAFQLPLNLLKSNASTSTVAAQFCSVPSISRLIVPVRLSILQAQQINSSLLSVSTYPTTIGTQSSYSVYIYSTRPSAGRSSYRFTSRGITTQKTTTTTTTTSLPIDTTTVKDISTVISTITPEIKTDSTSSTEFQTTEMSTKQTETSSIDFMTTSEAIEDTTITAEPSEHTTLSTDQTITSEKFQSITSSTNGLATTEVFEETTFFTKETTTYTIDLTSPSTESLSSETLSFNTDTTAEYSEGTSTYHFMETTTIRDESETTSTANLRELTSATTDDLSTITDATMEPDLSQTTISAEKETFSYSSTQIPLTTSLYDYSTETSPVFDSTTDRTEIDTSSSSFYDQSTISEIQSTYYPTSLQPQTAFLSTSTMEQYYTSLASTDIMTIESTITTDLDIGMSSSSSLMQTDSSTTISSISIGLEESSSSSNEYGSTQSLLTTDLPSTTSDGSSTDETDITTSELNTTPIIVSTSSMIRTSTLLNNLTDQQRLHSSSFTTTASLTNAYIESSSITSLLITHSSIQSTEDIDHRSTELLQTLSDTSFSTIDQRKTSIQDTSGHKSVESDSTAVTRSTNTNIFEFQTSGQSSNPSDDDNKSSTNLIESLSTGISNTSLTPTMSSTATNTMNDFITSSSTISVDATSTEFLSTIYKPIFIGSSVHTLTSSLQNERSSTSTETLISTSSTLLDIITSPDLKSNSMSSYTSVTNTDIIMPISQLITLENTVSSNQFSSSPWLAFNAGSSTTSSFSTNEKEPYSSTGHSLLSSSQSISTSGTPITVLSTTTTELLVETSFVPTSTVIASIPDVSLHHTLSSVEHMNELSTAPVVTADNNYMTSKTSILASSQNLQTDLISSIKSELTTTHLITETNDNILSTNSITILNTIEDTSNSNGYSVLPSSSPTSLKYATSIDTFTASLITDMNIATKISTVDFSFSTNSKTAETATTSSLDQTYMTTNNTTEPLTQSFTSLNSDHLFTTVLTSTVDDERTSSFILSSTVLSDVQSSIEIDTTMNSVTSTIRSLKTESTLNSSIHTSSQLMTNSDLVTPSTLTNINTTTVLSMTDTSTADDNSGTVSNDRTLLTNETSSTIHILSETPSSTYETLTQIALTTTSQLSTQTSTIFFIESDTTRNNIISTSIEHLSSPLLSTEQISTSSTTTPIAISIHSSNLITSVVQTVSTVDNPNEPLTLLSTAPITNDITTENPILKYSSTDINNDLTSTTLLQTSLLEHATNDKFNTLPFPTDNTDLTSPSTFHPLTLLNSSFNTLTSDISQNQENIIHLSTLSSIVQDSHDISTSASISVSDSSFKTDATTTATPTLFSTIQYASSSTERSPLTSSKYTNNIINEMQTQSTAIEDIYQTSIPIIHGDSKTSINPTTESAYSLSSNHDDVYTTSITRATMIAITSLSLTSSDQVSNIHTIIQTPTNNIKASTTVSEVLEDELSSTPHTETKAPTLPEISTNSDMKSTATSTSLMPFNQADKTTSDDQSTISHTLIETTSSSTQSSTSHQIPTQSSDTSSKLFVDQTVSTHEQTNQLSTTGGTTVPSVLQSTDVQHESSTSISTITTANSVTSPLIDTLPSTILTSITTSPTTQTLTNTDNIYKTSGDVRLSTTKNLNDDTISSMISSGTTRTSTEIFTTTTETSQTRSPTKIDLSSNAATLSIIFDSSTLQNSNIDPMSSESSPNIFIMTSKMMHKLSTIPTISTYIDPSSVEVSMLSTTTASTVDPMTPTNPTVSSSRKDSLSSTESNSIATLDITSKSPFTTAESAGNSIENILRTSPTDVPMANPITTTFQSSIVSSTHSASSTIPSTSDILLQDPMSSTQIDIDAQSSQFTSTTRTTSTTVPILSTQTDTTILPTSTTSITPSYSAFFVSTSFDNSIVTSSQNAAYAESTTQNMINTISSSISNSFTRDVSVSTNTVTQSSQGNSKAETTSSYTTQPTSYEAASLDNLSSSKSGQSTDERTPSDTFRPTDSTMIGQNSNDMSEDTVPTSTTPILTSSANGASLSFSLDSSSLPVVSTTSLTPVLEISTSSILDSVMTVSHSSISKDLTTVTKDRLSSSPYENQETLSTSQTQLDVRTEKITYDSKSFSFSSSETQTSTVNVIVSFTYSPSSISVIQITKPTLTSSLSTVSLSDHTDSVSSNAIQGTTSPSAFIQSSNLALSSEAHQDLQTSMAEQISESTTTMKSQTVSRQITENFDITTMSLALVISSSSDPTLETVSKQYNTDTVLKTSLPSEDINQQSTLIISSPASNTIERTQSDISKSSDNQWTLSNLINTQTTSATVNAMSTDDHTSPSLSSLFSTDIILMTSSQETEKLSSTSYSGSETSILSQTASDSNRASTSDTTALIPYLDANSTTADDQSTILHTVVETLSSSMESATSQQISSQTSDLRSSVDTSDTTSKVFNDEKISTHEQANELSTTGVTTVTSTLTGIHPSTILSSTIASATRQTSTNSDNTYKTSEDVWLSTKENLNEDTTSSIISSGTSRTSTEIFITTTETSQTKSPTNIELSSNAVTSSIIFDSSTLQNSNIDAATSESPANIFLVTTSEMMHETSTVPTIIANRDHSSILTSVLSTTTAPTADSTVALYSNLNSSQTKPVISAESDSTSTFDKTPKNSFTTVESAWNSIENLLETSTHEKSVTNPPTNAFQSTTGSWILLSSKAFPSASDVTSTTQFPVNSQSSQFTTSTQITSTTIPRLSTLTDTTILPSTTISMTPSYSATFVSNPVYDASVRSSKNVAFTETTVPNLLNDISSSIANSFTVDMSLTTNSITESPQGHSDAETISSYRTHSTSKVEVSLDDSISSQSSQSINEQPTFYTMNPTLSITSSQESNGVSEPTRVSSTASILTLSNDGTSSSPSLDTNSLPTLTTTSSRSIAALSISAILDAVIGVSDPSISQEFTTVTKDSLSSFKLLSSIDNVGTTSGSYNNQETLSSTQTILGSSTEKISYATKSVSSSQVSSNDLSSLGSSTESIPITEMTSSESETSTFNNIASSAHSSSSISLAESPQPTLTSSINTPSTFVKFSNPTLSSQAQQDLQSSMTKQNSQSITSMTGQTVSQQITETSDFTTILPALAISSSSDSTLNKIFEQYTTDKTLSSSLSSEYIAEQSTSIISSPTSDTIEQTSTDTSKLSDNQLTVSNMLSTSTAVTTLNIAATTDPKTTSKIINTISSDDYASSSVTSPFSTDILVTTTSENTETLSSISHTGSETFISPELSTDSAAELTVVTTSLMRSRQEDTTTSNDQSTTSHSVIETTSSSTQSLTSDQLTTRISEPTSSVDTSDTTLKVSVEQTSATSAPTNQLLTIDDTTITSVLRSTDVPHESSSLISTITTVASVTSPLADTRSSTTLSSVITSPTTQTSTNLDYSLNTSEAQPLTTKENLETYITSLMSALSSSRMAAEISVTTTETSQTKSQTNIDLSSNAVTPSITVEGTTEQQSRIDSSTLESSAKDTTNSDSPENNFMTTSKMMHETSPIPTIITNSDESSMGTSILSTTTVPPVDSTVALYSSLSSSLTNPTISTESEATSQFHKTSANLLTTTESHSNSIENLLTNSPTDITVTNPMTTAFDSTITSSVHSTFSTVASTSDVMTATQITMSAQSSQFTTTNRTISTTVSILSTQTGPTILPSITTSITPSYSALFVSNSFDNSIDTSSQNPAYAQTTTQNRINTISSSSSNIVTHDAFLSSTQSSQGYSDAEIASSYTTQPTSELNISTGSKFFISCWCNKKYTNRKSVKN